MQEEGRSSRPGFQEMVFLFPIALKVLETWPHSLERMLSWLLHVPDKLSKARW